MTLTVSVRDSKGNEINLGIGKQMAGAEVSRYEFWGHKIMVELGLELLPKLRNGGFILLQGTELDKLEIETHIILNNAHKIISAINQPKYGDEFLSVRVSNIRSAIEKAKETSGSIMIG